jgi:mono/diheme cytochrome c family protein
VRKVLRWLGYVLAGIVILAFLFAAWVWFASARVLGETHQAAAERLVRPTAAQLADAGRQARILGCLSCHGEGLRGRMMFDAGPVGRVWAPNLTELAPRINDQQLAQGIRQGIGHDGRALYVMPSPMYARLSDQEVAAMIAWMRGLPRSSERVPENEWGPLGRFLLAKGDIPSALSRIEEFRIRLPYDTGLAQAAGRRLAATVCSECHGPDLAGGRPTPDTLAPGLSIVGAYDAAQFRRLLRTGVPPSGRDLGLMRAIARDDTSHLTDVEINQLFGYLQARALRVQDRPPE